ncbi:MAG: hypothetical protein K2X66_07965, partial [Cyanobacteria bacterium]|nr:hypothetical protein [Cyanobacteriota bacterium]
KVLSQLGISQRGAIMDGLNMGVIKELKIPLPPFELQRQYEQITNKYHLLFQQQEEAERQAELNFQALLHRAFTGQLPSHSQVAG